MRIAPLILLLALLSCMTLGATFDFSKYKTCKDCITAGFGWCPIKRICGGFANNQCGEGVRYYREDYDPTQQPTEEQKPVKTKKAKVKEFAAGKVHSVSLRELSSALKGNQYWAVYFFSRSEKVGSLGNEVSLSMEEWAKVAKATKRLGLACGSVNIDEEPKRDWPWPNVPMVPSLVAFLDNRDDIPQLRFDNATAIPRADIAASWIVQEIDHAVSARISGKERLRRQRKDSSKVADSKISRDSSLPKQRNAIDEPLQDEF